MSSIRALELNFMRHVDTSGAPVSGLQFFFYEPGTTTKKDTYPTYTDASNQTNANSNPMSTSSGGLLSTTVYLRGAYKLVMAPSGDTDPPTSPIKTVDNLNTLQNLLDNNGNIVVSLVGISGSDDYLVITNADSGDAVIVETAGTSTDVPLIIRSKAAGDITLGKAAGTNDVNILTGDKSITLDEANDDITLDSGSGTIVMAGASGNITIDTDNGDLALGPTGSGDVIVNPTSGDVTINPGGVLTLQSNVFPASDGNAGDKMITDGAGNLSFKEDRYIKSASVNYPSSSEDISLFFTDVAITITQLNAVLVGSSTPSVTWTLRHGTDRSATGNEVVTGGTTTTNTTTGAEITSFDDATIPAGSFIWLETTAKSGTVNNIMVSLEYGVD